MSGIRLSRIVYTLCIRSTYTFIQFGLSSLVYTAQPSLPRLVPPNSYPLISTFPSTLSPYILSPSTPLRRIFPEKIFSKFFFVEFFPKKFFPKIFLPLYILLIRFSSSLPLSAAASIDLFLPLIYYSYMFILIRLSVQGFQLPLKTVAASLLRLLNEKGNKPIGLSPLYIIYINYPYIFNVIFSKTFQKILVTFILSEIFSLEFFPVLCRLRQPS